MAIPRSLVDENMTVVGVSGEGHLHLQSATGWVLVQCSETNPLLHSSIRFGCSEHNLIMLILKDGRGLSKENLNKILCRMCSLSPFSQEYLSFRTIISALEVFIFRKRFPPYVQRSLWVNCCPKGLNGQFEFVYLKRKLTIASEIGTNLLTMVNVLSFLFFLCSIPHTHTHQCYYC